MNFIRKDYLIECSDLDFSVKFFLICKLHRDWKWEFSAILCLSEEYDSSFDLKIHNGYEHGSIPYKFNQLNIFKCSENSWHGLPEITKGMDRKTLGVMFWSKDKKGKQIKAKFNNNLEFDWKY